MTSNVPKGAGRAAHAAKTAKHAQRTPLPPRGATSGMTKKVSAKVIADEVEAKPGPAARKRTARRSDPGTESLTSLLGPVAAKPRKAASKTATATPKPAAKPVATDAPKRGKQAATPSVATPRASKPAKKAAEEPRKAPTATPKPQKPIPGTRTPAAAKNTPTPKGGTAVAPSGSKSDALAAFAEASGWETKIVPMPDNCVTVSSERGSELIEVHFSDDKLDLLQMPTYTINGRTVKLRNVSAAKKQMVVSPEDALKAVPATGPKRERKPREKHDDDRGAVVLRRITPWEDESAEGWEDDDIVEAVRGKKLVWRNTIAGTYEDAHVLPMAKQKQLKIVVAPNGKRVLNWASCDDHGKLCGFRSVYIENIVQVKRGHGRG